MPARNDWTQTMTPKSEIENKLADTAWPYWEAEGEIAKRFYAHATPDDHAFYLRAQLWKELNPVDGYFNGLHRELVRLAEKFPLIDKEIDRHDYHFALTQLTEEFNHYVLLADIFEHIVARPIAADDTIQLPEEKKLGDLRRGYVESGDPITRAAVGFTEGGGAALFREGAKISGGDINDMTARAMKVICDDEKDHYVEMAKEAVGLIENDDDLTRMMDAIRAISAQRVWMRSEMFRDPMTRDEISGFIETSKR